MQLYTKYTYIPSEVHTHMQHVTTLHATHPTLHPYMAEGMNCDALSGFFQLFNCLLQQHVVIAGCGRRVKSLPIVPNISLCSLDAQGLSPWYTWQIDPPYIDRSKGININLYLS